MEGSTATSTERDTAMTVIPARKAAAHSPRTPAEPGELPSVARTAAWAMASCLGVTLLLLVVANVAGADLRVLRLDGRTVGVTPSSVVVTVLLAVLAGTILLMAVGRRSRRAWVGVAVVGLLVALLSAVSPLLSEAGPVATVALVSMHITCGLAWFTVLTSMLSGRR